MNPKQSGDYPSFFSFSKTFYFANVYRPADHTLTGDVIRAIIPLFLLAKENSVITNVAQFGDNHDGMRSVKRGGRSCHFYERLSLWVRRA